jgi:outer membrane protein
MNRPTVKRGSGWRPWWTPTAVAPEQHHATLTRGEISATCFMAWLVALSFAGATVPASAEPAIPPATVTFKEAIDKAIQRNPSVAQAAAEILRADALLQQARTLALPTIGAGASLTRLDQGRELGGNTATPQNQFVASATVSGLLYAPVQWALRAQAGDNRQNTELAAADVRRQVAVATGQAYLAVIARQRLLEANERAREVAQAHFEYARQRRESGAGSRLNELRAQQSVSSDEVLVEQSRQDLYRAQEALGVLVADDGPVNAADEPTLELPASIDASLAEMPRERTDLRLARGREQAAARVFTDSWKDWLPSVSGLFQPQYVNPSTLFQPTWSWRAQVTASMPIFDFGARHAKRAERGVLLDETHIAFDGLMRQAQSDVRTARDSVSSADKALGSARAAAQQAKEVVDIVNVSFRVGASTNIEVIDAQRVARDADNAVALAENQLRQARLALLVALGRFPQ